MQSVLYSLLGLTQTSEVEQAASIMTEQGDLNLRGFSQEVLVNVPFVWPIFKTASLTITEAMPSVLSCSLFWDAAIVV